MGTVNHIMSAARLEQSSLAAFLKRLLSAPWFLPCAGNYNSSWNNSGTNGNYRCSDSTVNLNFNSSNVNTNTNTNYNSVRLVRASILRDVVHGSFRFFFIL